MLASAPIERARVGEPGRPERGFDIGLLLGGLPAEKRRAYHKRRSGGISVKSLDASSLSNGFQKPPEQRSRNGEVGTSVSGP